MNFLEHYLLILSYYVIMCPIKVRELMFKKFNKGKGIKMEITDIRIRKVAKESKLKAVVSITLDHVFVIHDIKIIDGDLGRFIAMPSKKMPGGEYKDIVHPINTETRNEIQDIILIAYSRFLDEEEAMKEVGLDF